MGKKRMILIGALLALVLASTAAALPVIWTIQEQYSEAVGCMWSCWGNSKWYDLGGVYTVYEVFKEGGHLTGRSCKRADTRGFDGGIALFIGENQTDSWSFSGGCKKCWGTYSNNFSGKLASRLRVCGGNSDCHQQAYPFTINYHRKTLISSIGRLDDERQLGTVSEMFKESISALNNTSGWRAVVSSANPDVMVWVGAQDSYAQKSTSDTNAEIWACGDTNQNAICDANEAAARSCLDAKGDWYKGVCCGTQVTTCGMYTPLNAICGNTSEGRWEWAPVGEPGEIHVLDGCPGAAFLSDGAALYRCGDQDVTGTQPFGGLFRNVTVSGFTHEYVCSGNTISECAGCSDVTMCAFSTQNALPIGSRATGTPQISYCASDGDWTADLDTKDAQSCTAAGFSWTGQRCCSEADDGDEYYNDPSYPNGTGGCWKKAFIASGDSKGDRVLNYKGQFFGCRLDPETNSALLALKDTHTNDWLINNSIAPCGIVLLDAQPGGKPHAVCQPDGTWKFTDEPGGTINKSIAWSGLMSMTGIEPSGCCAYDQCWDGKKCQPLGSFYRIGDYGFVCKI